MKLVIQKSRKLFSILPDIAEEVCAGTLKFRPGLVVLVTENFLLTKGHTQAATYLENAKDDFFTYLKFWMKTGIVTHRVTSKLERLMREINRRVKKFAFNWSDKGAAIMTRLIIKLICSPKEWESYWVQRKKLSGKIKLTFEGIS
jgi:hypothetical protein